MFPYTIDHKGIILASATLIFRRSNTQTKVACAAGLAAFDHFLVAPQRFRSTHCYNVTRTVVHLCRCGSDLPDILLHILIDLCGCAAYLYLQLCPVADNVSPGTRLHTTDVDPRVAAAAPRDRMHIQNGCTCREHGVAPFLRTAACVRSLSFKVNIQFRGRHCFPHRDRDLIRFVFASTQVISNGKVNIVQMTMFYDRFCPANTFFCWLENQLDFSA